MALPSNVSFGTVVGRFMRAVADGPDPDRDPDGIPLEGLTLRFQPSATTFKNVGADPDPVTIIADTIQVTTDADGYVIGPDGGRGVRLLATDDPDLDPMGWTWRVTVSGPSIQSMSLSFLLPGDATVDLTSVVPVPSNPGSSLPQWEVAVAATEAARDEALLARDDAVAAAEAAEATLGTVQSDLAAAEGAITQLNADLAAVQGTVGEIEVDVQAALSAATDAEATASTANGKVTTSPNAPTAADAEGKPVGALWYRMSTAGTILRVWEMTGSGWATRDLTNAAIANLDAGKINAGFLDPARIQDGTITADKLAANSVTAGKAVITPANLVDDPDFLLGVGTAWDQGSSWFVQSSTGAWAVVDDADAPGASLRCAAEGTGISQVFMVSTFTVEPGEKFQVTYRVRREAALTAARLGIIWRTTDATPGGSYGPSSGSAYAHARPSSTSWETVTFEAEAPANTRSAQVVFQVQNNAGTGGQAWFAKPRVIRKVTADLIVDGAITAAKLAPDTGIPRMTASGTTNTTAGAYTTVTLPAGRFSSAPRVVASNGTQGTIGVSRIANVTGSSFQVGIWSLTGEWIAGTGVNWIAIEH